MWFYVICCEIIFIVKYNLYRVVFFLGLFISYCWERGGGMKIRFERLVRKLSLCFFRFICNKVNICYVMVS